MDTGIFTLYFGLLPNTTLFLFLLKGPSTGHWGPFRVVPVAQSVFQLCCQEALNQTWQVQTRRTKPSGAKGPHRPHFLSLWTLLLLATLLHTPRPAEVLSARHPLPMVIFHKSRAVQIGSGGQCKSDFTDGPRLPGESRGSCFSLVWS